MSQQIERNGSIRRPTQNETSLGSAFVSNSQAPITYNVCAMNYIKLCVLFHGFLYDDFGVSGFSAFLIICWHENKNDCMPSVVTYSWINDSCNIRK